MATAPSFDAGLDQPPSTPPQRSGWRTCLIGCLAACVVVVLVIAAVVFWISRNWHQLAANFGAQVMNQAINEMDLPEQEKGQMKAEVDRVVVALREGRISQEQLGRLLERMMQSPLVTTMMVTVIEREYLARSGLSDEEKAQARPTLQRFIRGSFDQKINEQETDAVLAHVSERGPDGQWELKDRVSDDELRAFLAAAKEAADKAGVPDQPEAIDPSDELRRIIDEALAEPQVASPPPPSAAG